MEERKFDVSDFTEDELVLLGMAFKLVDDVVEAGRLGNSDVYWPNTLFGLKKKLRIDDVV